MPDGPGSSTLRGPVPPMHGAGFRTAWTLWRRAEPPDALAGLALRTRSQAVLDALALAATDGQLTAPELLDRPDPPPLRPAAGAALALALAGLGRSLEELTAAARLYEALWEAGALPALAPIHHQALGQAFFLAGRHDRLREVLGDLTRLPAPVRLDLETDLANPHLSGVPAAPREHQRWTRLLGRRFADAGLEPPQVRDGTGHVFDRLTADPRIAGTVGGGPLVTVVMPCFRPDEGLLTSIASISGQSWSNLEILVVDDASGPDYADVFERAVASDSRARLVRLDRNGGSYLGRNAALAQSRGELVTFQDADDWSHPRRLEQQVRLLTEDPQAPASRSLAVRARDDLTHQWFGYRSVRDNASSLMLRRSVIDRIGAFAAIRKGADSEYAERVTSLLGPVRDTGTPLAITRLRTGTLSRGDFTYQWSTPDRLVFKGSYRALHRAAARSGTPVLGRDGRLRCPVPRSFLRGLDHAPAWDTLPVAYLGDLSADPAAADPTGPHARLWAELAVLLDGSGDAADGGDGLARDGAGGTEGPPVVGLWHLESPTPVRRKRPEMHDAWFDRSVASHGAVVPVSRLEEVRVERLVVVDPAVLLLAADQRCRLRADRVEVRLTPEALAPQVAGLALDLLAVGDTCRSWWGTTPVWVADPSLDDGRQALAELVPGLLSG